MEGYRAAITASVDVNVYVRVELNGVALSLEKEPSFAGELNFGIDEPAEKIFSTYPVEEIVGYLRDLGFTVEEGKESKV